MKMKTSVKVENRFPQLRRRIHEGAVPAALLAAAKDGAAVSAQRARERQETGDMADIRVTPAARDDKGWNVVFFSPAFYAWFHEHGTLGKRTRKLKQPGRRRMAA